MMILVMGGSSDRQECGALANSEQIDISNSHPPPIPDLSFPRRSPALFKIPCGHLLVLGGCSGPFQHLANGEILKYCKTRDDNGGRKWQDLAIQNINGFSFSCAAFCQLDQADDAADGFVFGGYDGNGCIDQAFRIDSHEPHSIKLLNSLPFGLKNSAVVPSMDSHKIYLIGGWDGQRTLTTIVEYDIDMGKYEIKRLLPHPLEGHSIAHSLGCAEGLAFIVGGFDGIGLRADILVMDRHSGKVLDTAGPKLVIPRENCAAVCFSNDQGEWLAIIGGWDGQKALDNWEQFHVLPERPWLRKCGRNECQCKTTITGDFKLKKGARNRPAAILI